MKAAFGSFFILIYYMVRVPAIQVTIGVILPNDTVYRYSLGRIMPAISIAIDKVTSTGGILQNKNVTFKTLEQDSNRSELQAPLAAMSMFTEVQLFLGPVYGFGVAPIARYSRYWNVPIVTAGAAEVAFKDKEEFSVLTRVGAIYEESFKILKELNQKYDWTKFGLIYHRAGPQDYSDCYMTLWAAYEMLQIPFLDKSYPKSLSFNENNSSGIDAKKLLQELSSSTRLIVMCANPDSIREIMLEAHRLGFTTGEYIFFNIDLFASKQQLEKPWYRENDSQQKNLEARKAYEALMTITLKKPDGPEYVAFSEEVKARARIEFGDFDYGEVNSFVGAFHDAVLLYSLALNETIAQNGSIKDGAAVTSRMWNRTFSGITGNVSIDSNGDKNSDYSLLNYDSDLEQFTAAGHYYGNVKLYQEVRPINWPGGRDSAPPDTPLCGFSGEGCVEEGKLQQWVFVTVIFSVILAIIGLIGVLYYRRYKAELELNSMSWRIRWDEIHDDRQRGGLGRSGAFPSSELEYGEVMLPLLPKLSIIAGMSQTAPRMSLTSKMHRNSAVGYSQRPSLQPGRPGAAVALNEGRRDSKVSYTSRLSIDTYAVMEPGIMGKQLQLFTKTAYYKKSVVALKSMSSPPYTINRAFLLEIKNIKNLQNDHIVRFIGMCVDPGHEYIVTEYCQKGSLQDIVENDQIDLDAMFKHSLIQDITRGMDYLHTSVIRYHGNLKSTNCVVDSRFVLKITDFGLKLCRQSSRKISSSEEEKYQMCRRKLWTAPELLDSQSVPSVQAYQKGDVYSFAVICQEVIYRKGVFYVKDKDFTEPEDILNELREDPSFRPTLRNEDCDVEQEAMLIRKCWSQEPMDRPDFQLVKNAYRRFMKHNGRGTLVENLLTRMEQYANNLESLVEDRTQSYLEQKKKAEDLLYMMLPKSIASDLIKGQSVKAEWFNEVTIYFSDICGFTALSAESTPMQIVAMLNDLYTDFDNAVEEFDVYKVETIGDAYMVVSGLPNRNGHNHAREIARLSLKLLEIVQTFTIRHKPTEKLKLRIGMHTGPVCAGVVGLKMPRYCLFGDTVNTASRMESNGLPLKIHVSPSTKILLDEFETFQLELRGEVEMKGKGTMTTYWLLGENQVENTSAKDLRQQPNSEEKQLASTAHPEKHTYRPYSITEETNLTVPPIASNLRHSDPDIGFIHNSLPLLPPGNSRPSRTPKFRENGVTFQSTSQEAPLLNGHADDTL